MSDTKPKKIIVGMKDRITTTPVRLTEKPTSIQVAVRIRCRSLGTGTYIAIGDEEKHEYRFTAVGNTHKIDYIDDLRKVYCITDAGSTGELEWIGG